MFHQSEKKFKKLQKFGKKGEKRRKSKKGKKNFFQIQSLSGPQEMLFSQGILPCLV